MTAAQGNFGGATSSGEQGPSDWRNASWRQYGCATSRVHPFEVVAILLGFMVFWPIGVAMLGFKLWQRAAGYGAGVQSATADKWRETMRAAGQHYAGARAASGRGFGFQGRDTGNAAFDEWRAQEIARLNEERRKLEEAQRDFAAFAETIRMAKDREEFNRFMNERANKPAGGAAQS